jgi:hypothetical protein
LKGKENEPMNQPENPERTNQTVEVDDLPIKTMAQQEVRGGNRVSIPTGTVRFKVDGL